MSEVAVGYVSLVPKFGSGFKAAIAGEVGGAGTLAGKQAGTSFRDTFLGVLAGNLMTSAISKIGGTIRSAVGGGFDRLMNIEQAEIKLRTLGLNVEQSMSSVNDAVDGTKFAISDAADMAAFLGASGIEAGAEMTKWLARTADASQFTNREFSDMQRTIGKVVAEGRVTGETFQELPLAAAALADYLGVSQEEVRKLASQGKISAEEFGAAMDAKIGGAAKNAGESFLSLRANMKTALNATLAALIEPFTKAAMPIMQSGLGLLKGFRDNVAKPLGSSLTEWLVPAAERLAEKMDALPAVFSRIREHVSPFVEALREGFSSVGEGSTAGIGGAISFLQDVFSQGKAALDGFLEGFGGFYGLLELVAPVITLLTGPLGILKTALLEVFSGDGLDVGSFASSIGGALRTILEVVGPLAQSIVGPLAGAFASLLPVALEVGQVILEVATGLIADLASVIAQLVTSLLPPLLDTFGQIVPVIAAVVAAVAPLIAQLVADLAPVLVTLVTSLLPPLLGAFQTLLPVVSTLIATFAPLIAQLVGQLAPILTNLITALLPPLISTFQTVVPAVASLVSAILPLVAVLIEQLAPIILQVVGTILPPLLGVLGELVALVVAVVVPAITQFVQVLSAVLIPIIQALLPIVSAVFGTIASVIGGVMSVIQGIIRTVTGIIRGDWSQVWSGIQQIFAGVWDVIKGIVSGALNAIVAVIRGALTLAWSVISGIFGTIVSFVAGIPAKFMSGLAALSNLGAKAREWVGRFKDGAVQMFSDTVSFVRGIPGKIMSALGNVGNLLRGSGRALIRGFTDGIRSAFSSAKQAVSDGLSNLRRLLPFSPAKEGPFSGKGYTLYSGRALMQDFAKGISQEQRTVKDELAGVLDASAGELDVGINASGSSSPAAPAGLLGAISVAGPLVAVQEMNVRNDDDIRRISRELQRLLDARLRSMGRTAVGGIG